LKNPKILILDEPTSALDSISESKITNIINKVMKNRTVIVIAHRLQTVMEAHKIIVLEK
jgi:ABC-type multidrug transport system fused ATPase/permease subunit